MAGSEDETQFLANLVSAPEYQRTETLDVIHELEWIQSMLKFDPSFSTELGVAQGWTGYAYRGGTHFIVHDGIVRPYRWFPANPSMDGWK
jgi:hypothetical protein